MYWQSLPINPWIGEASMTQFARNLELIRKASPVLADKLIEFHERIGEPLKLGAFTLEESKSGALTARYDAPDGESSYYLHSPYDPLREAEQQAVRALEDAEKGNFDVFMGFGLGYGVVATLARLPKKDRVLIFEPHWDLFYLALCHVDMSPVFTRDNTTITCDPSIQGAMFHYLNLFELAGFSGVRFIGSHAFDKLPSADRFKELAERIRYEMTAVGGNVQTLMVMGEMQQMNIILNFPEVLDNPPFEHLIGRFKDRPAIIVSAGPSLEKNMHHLHELQDRALIIAVDTSVKPLLAAGIKPHVVVTGDPQEANYRHLKGVDLPDVWLIAEPQSPVNSLRDWTGPKFICTFHDNLMRWVDRVMGTRGRVMVWGSVAVMAYDVAVKVGANPIVFIGQDLSFPGGKTYTKGTFFETEDKMELTVDELKAKGGVLIEMTDIYGEKVMTNRQMYAYFNFLKNRFEDPEVANRTIINATEGGILQCPKVRVMPLETAIEQYMGLHFNVRGMLEMASREGNPLAYTNLLIELDALLGQLRDLLDYCHKGEAAVRQTLRAVEAFDDSLAAKTEMVEQYNRMLSYRKKLLGRTEASSLLEMANQTGIFSFAQGVKNTQPDEEGHSPEFLKRSCYHHHTLYVTSRDAVARLIPLFERARFEAGKRAASAKRPEGLAVPA